MVERFPCSDSCSLSGSSSLFMSDFACIAQAGSQRFFSASGQEKLIIIIVAIRESGWVLEVV